MENYFDGFSEDITKWEIIREMIDLDLDNDFYNELHKNNSSVKLLSRQDLFLYGTIPKIEQRIYSKCKECRQIFNPRDILSHKTCSGKLHISVSNKKSPTKWSENMEDYFEGFSEDITKWEIIREMIDLNLDNDFCNELHKNSPSVKLLPRQDFILYGTIPKIEQRIYTKCKECRQIFNPRDILSHKSCSGKLHVSVSNKKSPTKKAPFPVSTTTSASESKSASKSSSKIPKSTISLSSSHAITASSKSEARLSSVSSHTTKASSVHSPKSPSKSVVTTVHSPKSSSKNATNIEATVSSTVSSSSSTSNSSSRYKKSRKSNNNAKISKEFDPDVHCGVVEGSRGPCTRSITCSIHRIRLRKLVPGRSKDIHQLIAERKATKEKELKHGSSSNSYTSPNVPEEKEVFYQNTSYVPAAATTVNNIDTPPTTTTYVPIMPKTSSSITSKPATTSIHTAKQLNVTDTENKSTKTLDGTYLANIHNNSHDSAIGTVVVVYMPMSPISVVSPVQFMQLGKNMICLESPQSATSPPLTTNQSVFLTIPSQSNNQQSNFKMYKSHPKPIAIPSYGTKKVGGAILLSNQRIESQRNDILMALNTKRETVTNAQGFRGTSLLNHINTPHRPNILKVKSASKVSCKRPAADKLSNISDSKQLRLGSNVNGFILHSDISESADAPQSNNCI